MTSAKFKVRTVAWSDFTPQQIEYIQMKYLHDYLEFNGYSIRITKFKY